MHIRRFAASLLTGTTVILGLTLTQAPAGAVTPNCVGPAAIASKSFTMTHVDGSTTTTGHLRNSSVNSDVRPGDIVTVTFTIKEECEGTTLGLASYRTESATFDPDETQTLFDDDTVAATGTHSLTVTVPSTAADGTTGCPNKHQDGPETKGKGANTSGPYNSTCDGSPSQNGKGDGNANGKPCAGCVGNADDKNPPGQMPDGSDHNAGYECDRNQGVGKTNPAHSGCKPIFFQVDFYTGPTLQTVSGSSMYGARLIDAYNGPK